MLRLHDSLEDPRCPLETSALLVSALVSTLRRHASPALSRIFLRGEAGRVWRMREYLEGHFGERVTLADLAALVGASPFVALRMFRDQVGLPPHAYQLERRLREAKRLLAADVPPTEVALSVGFSDASHLSRHFGRWMHVSPGRYRQACQSAGEMASTRP